MVVSVLREVLGADQEAWDRFATRVATYAGPVAWLRLGDLLDADAVQAPWLRLRGADERPGCAEELCFLTGARLCRPTALYAERRRSLRCHVCPTAVSQPPST